MMNQTKASTFELSLLNFTIGCYEAEIKLLEDKLQLKYRTLHSLLLERYNTQVISNLLLQQFVIKLPNLIYGSLEGSDGIIKRDMGNNS
jgi:hypothetical protein